MQGNLKNRALEQARWFLRTKQREYDVAASPMATPALVTDASLGFLDRMTEFRPTEDADRVRRGPWTFDRDLEVERITCAKSLIRRTMPGPLEDPNYFALLAYQAASIQIANEHLSTDRTISDRFSRYVLGTVFSPELNAFATRVPFEGYGIVVVHSGLIDFVYQAAKAVVEALHPTHSTTGRSAVSALFDLDVIRERLRSDPTSLERLYRTLEAYFFYGYPRASSFETVLGEQSPPLSLLVSMAERWIIGHEYGHGLVPTPSEPPPNINVSWAREYSADAAATIATVRSAAELDGAHPEFALGGGIFALACLDILVRSSNVLRTGNEMNPGAESETHPQTQNRATELIAVFRQFFDVRYGSDGQCDVDFVIRPEAPKVHNFTSERVRNAYAFTTVLQTIWQPVRQRLLKDYKAKRALHSNWGK